MVILEIFWHCFSHMIDIDTKNLDDDDDVIIFSGSCSWSEGMWAAKSSETMTPWVIGSACGVPVRRPLPWCEHKWCVKHNDVGWRSDVFVDPWFFFLDFLVSERIGDLMIIISIIQCWMILEETCTSQNLILMPGRVKPPIREGAGTLRGALSALSALRHSGDSKDMGDFSSQHWCSKRFFGRS